MFRSGSLARRRVHCIQKLALTHLQLPQKLSFILCEEASRKQALATLHPGQRGRAQLPQVILSKIFEYSEENITLLAVGGETNITIWDVSNTNNNNSNISFPVYGILEVGCPTLCFSTLPSKQNGKRFVSGNRDGIVRIWTFTEHDPHYKMTSSSGREENMTSIGGVSVIVNVGNDRFASSSGGGSGIINIWSNKTTTAIEATPSSSSSSSSTSSETKTDIADTARRELSLLKTLHGHATGVRCMLCFQSVTSGIHFIVSGALGKDICVFNSDSGKCVIKLLGHRGPITKLCMADATTLVSLSTDKRIRFWSIEDDYMAAVGSPVLWNEGGGFTLLRAAPSNSEMKWRNQLFVGNNNGICALQWSVSSKVNGTHKSRSHLPVSSRWQVKLLKISKHSFQSRSSPSSILPLFDVNKRNCGLLVGSSDGGVYYSTDMYTNILESKPHTGRVIAITKITDSVYAAGSSDGTTSIIELSSGANPLRCKLLHIPTIEHIDLT